MYLKPISFLSGWSAVPFHQMIIWSIEIFVEFDNQTFKERREFPLYLQK